MVYEFPLTNDLLTMTHLLCTVPDREMRGTYGMVINDYRTLAYVEQGMACTVTELARALDVAKCKASGYVSKLCTRGFIARKERVGSKVLLATTEEGSRFARESRVFLASVFERMLSPLNQSQRNLYDMGCTATATMADGFRLVEEAPDFVYIYLRSCLLTELFVTKTTRKYRLSLNEFRILFALLQEKDVLTSSDLMTTLLLPKATTSDCVQVLRRRGLLGTVSLDGRSKGLSLTLAGRVLAERAACDVDRSYVQDVRSAQPFERNLYVEVASEIVANARK
ncbi:MAG: MarR family winged helix-turn-helix transcriptional regulator [Eggerthellaceae bacterium]|nr:MarR family winged helix-turn-helix transcriptional regulator [Eggerthellaceae bacterium]